MEGKISENISGIKFLCFSDSSEEVESKEQLIISRYLEDLGILPDLDHLVYHLALGIPLDLDHLGILLHLLHLNYIKETKKV